MEQLTEVARLTCALVDASVVASDRTSEAIVPLLNAQEGTVVLDELETEATSDCATLFRQILAGSSNQNTAPVQEPSGEYNQDLLRSEHIANLEFFLPATLMCTRDTNMYQSNDFAAGALRTLRKVMEFQINPTDRRRMLATIDPASNVATESALPARNRQFLPGNHRRLASC